MDKLVSIVLPVYNGEKFLEKSIKSCLGQTHNNLELIIVNDCSTDSSLAIAKKFQVNDSRVTVINNTINKKLPASLNIGHQVAKGNYLTWTSDDNFYEVDAIEKLLKKITETDNGVVYAEYNILFSDGSIKRTVKDYFQKHILIENCIGCCFLYTKEVFQKCDGFSENLHTIEDYDFWLKAFKLTKFGYIPEVLYNYRLHPNSLTSLVSVDSSDAQKSFENKILLSYQKFFATYHLQDSLNFPDLFLKLNRQKLVNVSAFLNFYNRYREDLLLISKKTPQFEFAKLENNIFLRLRILMMGFTENQNIKTLFSILKNRPSLIFGYDKRRSLKYVLICIFRNY